MDDAFQNIVLAIMWGRCVNDSVKKFLQFQISVNITAVFITFISAVASSNEESVLSAVQLLWVNLIMDTFAALALATDPATESSLERKPDKKNAPLITVEMFKMIMVQAIYQIIVCLVLHFAGLKILGLENNDQNNTELGALVFNCFVFCQICRFRQACPDRYEFNSRLCSQPIELSSARSQTQCSRRILAQLVLHCHLLDQYVSFILLIISL